MSYSATYLPDWLSSDGGRVVFDSADQLVPWDTNGRPDVYEWERDGTGSCVEGKGCLLLLSGGVSTSASWLAGESATGDDVFVISRDQLAAENHEETFNLFDARVGGVEPVSEPSCAGTGCQGVPFEQPVFATPASATFQGVGNFPPVAEPAVKHKSAKRSKKKKGKKKGKGKVRARRKSTVGMKGKRSVRVGRGRFVVGGRVVGVVVGRGLGGR